MGFNLAHFFDPLGVTFGKNQGGGAANFWDPANTFTSGASGSGSSSAQTGAGGLPAPQQINYTQSALDYINAMTNPALQNQLYQSEAQYRPQYNNLNLADMQQYLLGSNGQPGLLDLQGASTAYSSMLQNQANSTQRQSDINDVSQLGLSATNAFRNANPYLLQSVNQAQGLAAHGNQYGQMQQAIQQAGGGQRGFYPQGYGPQQSYGGFPTYGQQGGYGQPQQQFQMQQMFQRPQGNMAPPGMPSQLHPAAMPANLETPGRGAAVTPATTGPTPEGQLPPTQTLTPTIDSNARGPGGADQYGNVAGLVDGPNGGGIAAPTPADGGGGGGTLDANSIQQPRTIEDQATGGYYDGTPALWNPWQQAPYQYADGGGLPGSGGSGQPQVQPPTTQAPDAPAAPNWQQQGQANGNAFNTWLAQHGFAGQGGQTQQPTTGGSYGTPESQMPGQEQFQGGGFMGGMFGGGQQQGGFPSYGGGYGQPQNQSGGGFSQNDVYFNPAHAQNAYAQNARAQNAYAPQGQGAMLGAAPQVQGQGYNPALVGNPNQVGVGPVGQGSLGQSLYSQAIGANGLGQVGNALNDRAMQFAQSTGQLTPDEIRNLQQSVRSAYADRGTLDSSGAVSAEALARLSGERQKQTEDLGMASTLNQGSLAEQGANRSFAQGVANSDIARQMQNTGYDLTGQQANQQANFQAGLANQASANQSGQFGASAANQANLSNQSLLAQYGLANQASSNQFGSQNLGLLGQYGLSNQGAQNQFALSNQAAQNQFSLSNQGYGNQFALANMQYGLQNQEGNRAFGAQQQQQNIANLGLLGQANQGSLTSDRQYALQLAALQQQMASDPFQSILGRSSGALGAGQQTTGQAGQYTQQLQGPQLFDPNAGINLALQQSANTNNYNAAIYGANAASQGAASAGSSAGNGAIIGSVIGAAAMIF